MQGNKPTQQLNQVLSKLGNIKGAGLAASVLSQGQGALKPTSSHSGYLSAPKYANATKLLWEAAHYYNLKLNIDDRDKGWIRETVYFTVTGSRSNINKFNDSVAEALEDWKNR